MTQSRSSFFPKTFRLNFFKFCSWNQNLVSPIAANLGFGFDLTIDSKSFFQITTDFISSITTQIKSFHLYVRCSAGDLLILLTSSKTWYSGYFYLTSLFGLSLIVWVFKLNIKLFGSQRVLQLLFFDFFLFFGNLIVQKSQKTLLYGLFSNFKRVLFQKRLFDFFCDSHHQLFLLALQYSIAKMKTFSLLWRLDGRELPESALSSDISR